MKTLEKSNFENRSSAASERFLVAVDLTDTDCLMAHAIAQAKASRARVTLIHALPPSDGVPFDGAAIPYVNRAEIAHEVRELMLGVARQFEAEGIVCETVVRDGSADDVIREELRRTNATRIIMGTHGRGKLGQLALGSVAHGLIAKVPVPIFVVGPHARDSVQHVTPRRILHPVSLEGDFHQSLYLAFQIAQTYDAELTLLHVLDQDIKRRIDPERCISWAKKALDALIPSATSPVSPMHTRVVSGNLVEEILKAAVQTDADWIVLGADGGLRSWYLPETAACKTVATAPCPVLTLRHEPSHTVPANLEEVHFTSPA